MTSRDLVQAVLDAAAEHLIAPVDDETIERFRRGIVLAVPTGAVVRVSRIGDAAALVSVIVDHKRGTNAVSGMHVMARSR